MAGSVLIRSGSGTTGFKSEGKEFTPFHADKTQSQLIVRASEASGSCEIDCAFFNDLPEGEHLFNKGGVSIRVVVSAGKLSLELMDPVKAITLTGALKIKDLSISSSSLVKLALDSSETDSLHVNAGYVVLENVLNVTSISLTAKEAVQNFSNLTSDSLEISAKKIINHQCIDAERVNLQAEVAIVQKGQVVAKDFQMKAKRILQKGFLSAEKIVISSSSDLINEGRIYSEQRIDLNVKKLSNKGHLYSVHTLFIQADEYHSSKKSTVRSQAFLCLNLKKMFNSGRLISDMNAFIKADYAENNGCLTLGEEFDCDFGSLRLGSDSKLTSIALVTEQDKPLRHIKTKDALVVEGELELAHADLHSLSLVTIAPTGSVSLVSSAFRARNLDQAGQLQVLGESIVTIHEETVLQDRASLIIEASEFESSSSLRCISEATLTVKGSGAVPAQLSVDRLTALGNITLENAAINADHVTLGGEVRASQCELGISEHLVINAQDKKIELESCRIGAGTARVKGQVDFIDSEVLAEAIRFKKSSSVGLQNTKMTTTNLMVCKDTSLDMVQGSRIESDDFIMDGSMYIDHSQLKSGVIAGDGSFDLESSEVDAPGFMRMTDATRISNSRVNTGFFNVQGEHALLGSSLNADFLMQAGVGSVKDSRLMVDQHMLSRDAKLAVDDSVLVSGISDLEGELTARGGDAFKAHGIHTRAILLSSGRMAIEATRLHVERVIHASDTSSFELNAGPFEPALASARFEGSFSARQTRFTAESLSLEASATMLESQARIDTHLNLAGKAQDFSASSLHADTALVSGGVTFGKKSALRTETDLVISDAAEAVFDDSGLRAKSAVLSGHLDLRGSGLSAENLSVLGHLQAKASQLIVDDVSYVAKGARFDVDQGAMKTRKLFFSGAGKLQDLSLTVDEEARFMGEAKVETAGERGLQLDGKAAVSIGDRVSLSGETLGLKAGTIHSRGTVSVKRIKVDTEWLTINGYFGGEAIQIEADRAVTLTPGARLTANKTTITSAAVMAVGAHINGNDRLSIQTLFNANIGGVYSGFDVDVNSVASLNAGLMLPSIPTSMEELKSPARWLRLGTMLASQAMPGYAGIINFASTAAPLMYKAGMATFSGAYFAGKTIYDGKVYSTLDTAYTSAHKAYTDARTCAGEVCSGKKPIFELMPRARDLVPMALQAKSLWVTGTQAYDCMKTAHAGFTQLTTLADAPVDGSAATPSRYEALRQNLRKHGEKAYETGALQFGQLQTSFSSAYEAFQRQDMSYFSEFLPSSVEEVYGAAYVPLTCFGPSLSSTAAFNANLGFMASTNLTQTDFWGFDAGASYGFNNMHNSVHLYHSGDMRGYRTTATGSDLHTSGHIGASGKLSLYFSDVIDAAQESDLRAPEVDLRTKAFKSGGKVAFGAGAVNVGSLEQSSTGDAEFDKTVVSATEALLGGRSHFDHAARLQAEHLEVAQQATAEFHHQSSAHAQNITNAGRLSLLEGSFALAEKKFHTTVHGTTVVKGIAPPAVPAAPAADANLAPAALESDASASPEVKPVMADTAPPAPVIPSTPSETTQDNADSVGEETQSQLLVYSLKTQVLQTDGILDLTDAVVVSGEHRVIGSVSAAASYLATQQMIVAQGGSAALSDHSVMAASSVANAGQLDLGGSTLRVSAELHNDMGGHMNIRDGSHAVAQSVRVDGHVDVSGSELKSKTDIAVNESGHLAATSGAQVNAAGNIINAGNFSLQQASHAKAGKMFHTTSTGQTHAAGIILPAILVAEVPQVAEQQPETDAAQLVVPGAAEKPVDEIAESAKPILAESTITAGTSLVTDGEMKLLLARAKAKDVLVNGNLDADQSIVEAKDKLTLAAGAHLQTHDAHFEASDIEHAAEHDFTGVLSMEASASLNTTESSHLRGINQAGQQSALLLKAQEGALKGHSSAQHGEIAIAHLQDAKALVEGTGVGAQQQFDSLGVELDEDLRLDTVHRDADLSVKARSIALERFAHQERDLALSSTVGDVRTHDIAARDFGVDSAARYVHTGQAAVANAAVLAKQGAYVVGGDMKAAGSLGVSASEISVITRDSAEFKRLAAGGALDGLDGKALAKASGAGGSLVAEDLALEAREGNIDNHGGTLRGTRRAILRAKKDIRAIANEVEYQGKHSKRKAYKAAVIAGGQGAEDDPDHVGLMLLADGQIVNDASLMAADGKLYASARLGIKATDRSHQYVADQYTKKKKICGIRVSKKTVEVIATDTQKAAFASAGDQVILHSTEGGVDCIATDFVTAKGTIIQAKKTVTIKGRVAQTKVKMRKTGFLGINRSSSEEDHEYTVQSLLTNTNRDGITLVESLGEHVDISGTAFKTRGELYLRAKKGAVRYEAVTLNHHKKTKDRKLWVRSPAVELAKALVSGDVKSALMQTTPLAGAVSSAMGAQHPLEAAAAASNMLVHAYQAASLVQPVAEGAAALAQQASQLARLASLQIGITDTVTDHRYQTVDDSGIQHEGHVGIEAGEKIVLDSVGFNAESASLVAPEVVLSDRELHSRYKQESSSISVGISLAGVDDVSASHSRARVDATTHAHLHLNVSGNLHVEAQRLALLGASVDASTLTGHVDEMHRESHQDQIRTSSFSASASTSGMLSVMQARQEVSAVAQAAGIHVRDGINHDEAHSFSVGHDRSVGSYVTVDPGRTNAYKPESSKADELHDYRRGRSLGFAGNVNSLFSAMSGDEGAAASHGNFALMHGKEDYRARQRDVVGHAAPGSMPTLVVDRDTHYSFQVDVPLAAIATAVQSAKAMVRSSASAVEGAAAPASAPEELSSEAAASAAAELADEVVPAPSGGSRAAAVPGLAGGVDHEVPSERHEGAGFPDDVDFDAAGGAIPKYDGPLNSDELGMLMAAQDQATDEADYPSIVGRKFKAHNVVLKPAGPGGNRQQLSHLDSRRYMNPAEGNDFVTEPSISAKLLGGGYRFFGAQLGGGASAQAELNYDLKAKYDPLKNKYSADLGGGLMACFTLASMDTPLGELSVNAASVEALAKLTATGDLKRGAYVDVSVKGVAMGPHVNYNTSVKLCFLGFSFEPGVEAVAGCGVGGALGAGAKLGPKGLGFYGKIGTFFGLGGSVAPKMDLGFDPVFHENMSRNHSEIYAEDSIAQQIVTNMQRGKLPSEWEVDHLDNLADRVIAKTMVQEAGRLAEHVKSFFSKR